MLGINISDVEGLVADVESAGVYFVPALNGLFSPYWDPNAKSIFIGMERGTTRDQMIRAVLEGVAFRAGEILRLLQSETNFDTTVLRVDGGMARNALFLQLLSDITGVTVEVPENTETTILGAAIVGAMGIGDITSLDQVKTIGRGAVTTYRPTTTAEEREAKWNTWTRVISRSLNIDLS
jgi:glycerol kinase